MRHFLLWRIDQVPDALLAAWHEYLIDAIDERVRRTRDEHRGDTDAA